MAKINCLIAASFFSVLFIGCESSDDGGSYWETKSSNSQKSTETASSSSAEQNSIENVGGAADELSFHALRWTKGGINASGAVKTTVSIGGLRTTKNDLYYSWVGDTLSSWGIGYGNADAVACFFVQQRDGAWIGGKFDWISTSRTHRSIAEIIHGWGLANLLNNPCPCAFVIVSRDFKKRSNVITSTWSW